MNASAHTIEVSAQNFQQEVAEKSKQTPVLLEFYVEGAAQSAEASLVLGRLVAEYQGKFILARVNVEANPQLVQQLGVRTLPTIKIIFQGQIAQDLAGPIDEPGLRDILDQLTVSPMERVREQIDVLLKGGDRQAAIQMLRQVIAEEPKNYGLHAELGDLLIMEGQVDDARKILAALPADTQGIEKPRNRLAFVDEVADLPGVAELQAQIKADPDAMQPRYQLAICLIVADQIEQGLEELLILLKQNKLWEEELARKTMIKVFDMLGKGDETATRYRRKMFTFLH